MLSLFAPLQIAAECEDLEYTEKNVQMLVSLIDNYNGDIINQKNRDGETPLDNAYNNRSPIKKDIVALLRQYGGK